MCISLANRPAEETFLKSRSRIPNKGSSDHLNKLNQVVVKQKPFPDLVYGEYHQEHPIYTARRTSLGAAFRAFLKIFPASLYLH